MITNDLLQPSHANPILDEIEGTLFGVKDEPNLSGLQDYLRAALGLSGEQSQKLIYEMVRELNGKFFPPVTHLELILTEGCNLACSYCFEKNMLGYKKMPLGVAEKAIDLLFDYSRDQKKLHITHFGGEPTMNFAAIKHSTEYAECKAEETGKSVEFDMTSNGVLLNEEMVDYLVKHRIMVLLSIDGLQKTHDQFRLDKQGNGTFAQVMKNFQLLKKKQQWVGVKMTVMPPNVHNLYNDVLGLYELGVNQFIIGYATGIRWPEKEMQVYNEQLAKLYQWYKDKQADDLRIDDFDEQTNETFFGCQAGRNSLTVTINGEVSPCSKILALNKTHLLAKLGDTRFGLTHFKNRLDLVSCSKLESACKQKGIEKDFQGGCFASNYEDGSDLFQPSMQDYTFSKMKRSACSGCSACGH